MFDFQRETLWKSILPSQTAVQEAVCGLVSLVAAQPVFELPSTGPGWGFSGGSGESRTEQYPECELPLS